MFAFALLLAVVWGICVACFTDIATHGNPITDYLIGGHLITKHMAWFVVSLGVMGDLLIVLLLLMNERQIAWWQIGTIFAFSSLGLLARGLLDFLDYYRVMLDIAQELDSTQDIDVDGD